MAAARKIPKQATPVPKGRKQHVAERGQATVTPPQETPAPSTILSSKPRSCVIVGIGASAGGLQAMQEFFRHTPPSSGMAYVVVSHQHAGHVSLLPSLLGTCTTMRVAEATDGMEVEPNQVYVAPGGSNLAILHGTLQFMEAASLGRVPLPIDYFFRSLAEDQQQRAVGIIFSGTGTDGTLGLRAIKAESGLTIAQEPQSATYQGMPRNAIAAGVVDVVKPADQMSEPLLAYARSLTRPVLPILESDASQTLRKVFILLRDRTGNDFTLYKENTIHRRIERRMNVHQLDNLKQYLRFVLANPHELDALFRELLIGVTSFFRDPEAFEVLAQKGLPALVEGKSEDATLRIWVVGCSTGEEAYSLAMLIREYLPQRKFRLRAQIFASDLDSRAIEQARTGLYPVGIAGDLTPERLQRFFTKEDDSFRVTKEIRDLVVFATHNVLTDAPFTKLDLLVCRNLLIYLEAEAQRKLFPLFHYALNPNGILFLGSSETISEAERHFAVLDRKWKLFQRTAEPWPFPQLEQFPHELMKVTAETYEEAEAPRLPVCPATVSDVIQQLLVSRYAPPSVVVNARGEAVYIHGHTGPFLQPAPGLPTRKLVEMAREGLRHALATALHEAAGKADEVVRRHVRVKANGDVILVNLTVQPLADPEALQGLYLVAFDQVGVDRPHVQKGAPARAAATRKKGESGLMQELEFTKQRLRRTIEEQHTSHEELQSTNEELQSTNEELQSTNEELETAKEELQSLNEELLTVNAELQGRLDAWAEAHDDLTNLLNSTGVATIFLDNNLRIRRFTTEAKRVSHLIALDVGRPLWDIRSKLTYNQLSVDVQDVLQTLVAKEQDVQTTDGSWFSMRIVPYRTAKNTIDGLVLTFLDITKMKEAARVVTAARSIATSIVETVREPLLVLDDQLRVTSANQSFYRTFQVAPREVEQQLLYHLCSGAWNIPELRSLLEEILPKHTSFQDFIVDQTFPHIGRKVFTLNGRLLEQEVAQPGRVLLAMEEVNGEEQKEGPG
ncbi:MAG: CheR family methyltransferase [Nitrospira sp.]